MLTWLVSCMVSPLFAASLFEAHELLEIELTGPMWSLIKNKEDRKERLFQLQVDDQELDIQVRARGNSRMRVCDFPPLRFNFKNSDTLGAPFEGQGKLKLVTRCRKPDRYENDVLEEYAAYRIFSLFSDVSFRTRLVRLTYNDIDGRLHKSYRTSYGFLIEPLDHLVSRVDGSLSGLSAVALGKLDKKQAALVYVFQYFIANTDWSFVSAENDEFCCHNIELVRLGNMYFPVPYDFDLAGIVNASYAKPDASLHIKKVSHRLYRGFCTESEYLRGALRSFIQKEDDILGLVASLPILDQKEKTKRIKFLEAFFKQARDEDKMISMFERRCHP